jgi:hypothetical protein
MFPHLTGLNGCSGWRLAARVKNTLRLIVTNLTSIGFSFLNTQSVTKIGSLESGIAI